ncbi:hypothetical protein WJX82_001361 [Trebouxia sp. C0006]
MRPVQSYARLQITRKTAISCQSRFPYEASTCPPTSSAHPGLGCPTIVEHTSAAGRVPDDKPGVCSKVKGIMMSRICDSMYGCPGCMSPHASSEDETSATCVPKGLGPRIYVGGIPNALSQTMIKNHFSHYGKVVDVYFPKHPVTSQRQAFCFVTFSTRKAANAAVSQSNRKINGQQAYTMSPDKMPPTCLHLPTVAHNLWAGQTTLAPTLPTAQDMSSALDVHSLLVNPLDSLNNQAALALLLAANRQGSALPGWPGVADSMHHPALPSMLFGNNISPLIPDVPDVQMAGVQSEPCEMSFGHGPRRHSNVRDVQYVRHSPY